MHRVLTLSVRNTSVVDACYWCKCSDDILVKLFSSTMVTLYMGGGGGMYICAYMHMYVCVCERVYISSI